MNSEPKILYISVLANVMHHWPIMKVWRHPGEGSEGHDFARNAFLMWLMRCPVSELVFSCM